MSDYQAVSSGYEISKKIADLLEDIDPIQYNGSNRARRVRNVNDYIQGRNDMPLEPLLDWAAKADSEAYAGRVAAVRQMLQAFQRQKSLLSCPYQMPYSLKSAYKYCLPERSDRAKVIDQETFDRVAQSGFPYGFFDTHFLTGWTFTVYRTGRTALAVPFKIAPLLPAGSTVRCSCTAAYTVVSSIPVIYRTRLFGDDVCQYPFQGLHPSEGQLFGGALEVLSDRRLHYGRD